MFFKIAAALLFTMHLQASFFIVGDSHVRAFEGIPDCEILWLGPLLMHRVGRDSLDLSKYQLGKETIVIYVFGEIDVRCHIGKQRDLKMRDEKEVIETLAQKFIEAVLKNPYQSIVYNVIPPTLDGGGNPDYPAWGSLSDRVRLTKQLNEELKRLCNQNQIYFLDVYEAYSREDGSLRIELSDGNVHIDPRFNEPLYRQLQGQRTPGQTLTVPLRVGAGLLSVA